MNLGLPPLVQLAAAVALLLAHATAAEKSGEIFNGTDFTGWRQPAGKWLVAGAVALDSKDPRKFAITPGTGIVVNGPEATTADLVSVGEFGDLELHLEFCIAKHSNSGIYLMGNYEVQVYDSFGVVKDEYPGLECGGAYPRWIAGKNVEGHSPRVNASKPAGEWQSFDITFRAPRFDSAGKKIANAKFVKVLHNGKLIHENLELTGPTRGGVSEQEKATGPLRLQGDHGPVAYRQIRLTPLDLK
jgi:hypothetical protein